MGVGDTVPDYVKALELEHLGTLDCHIEIRVQMNQHEPNRRQPSDELR